MFIKVGRYDFLFYRVRKEILTVVTYNKKRNDHFSGILSLEEYKTL